MQRKVEKMRNMGRTTEWIHREELVRSGRVNNLGCVMYGNIDERGRLYITIPKKGEEEKRGRGEKESRIL